MGLTLAWAKAPDRDAQASAAGDGPQLALTAIGDSIRATDLGHMARMLGAPCPAPPCPHSHSPSLTLVVLVPGQVGAGHTQRAEPASSTQDAPNSHRTSAQVLGTKESEAQTQETLLAREPRPTEGAPARGAEATPGPASPVSQPAGPRSQPSGHCPHLGPATPGLQEHSPVICSQSSRTAPWGSQLQAGGRGRH